MILESGVLSTEPFAARCYRLSQAIHWLTVALASGLLITAPYGNVDPHWHGSDAFRWHGSLAIVLYLLSMSRVLLWLMYLPTAAPMRATGTAEKANRGLRAALYALLVALAVSGWWLASEEGSSAQGFGIPVLPQLIRLHASLGAALAAVIIMHIFVAIGHLCSLRRASPP